MTPRTITHDGQTVTIYETQVTHPATGTILWASASGVIASRHLGIHVLARMGTLSERALAYEGIQPRAIRGIVFEAFTAAHQQAIGLEAFALAQRAKVIVERWKAEGYDTLASSSDGRCYPCHSEDIPRGAIDSYDSIASSEALEALVRSLREGWKYAD